ncbi:MAG: HAMP domain-containing histidine kinase, partial [Methanomicrobia archaeon]|nr:HAMP domain-containing histidine kinase [Methanomicrobia archaeon]
LGLAIVKEAVALHNGKVWIEDSPDGGTVFKVKLPKSRADA